MPSNSKMSQITQPANLDFNDITFGEKNTIESGASFVNMKLNGDNGPRQILLQLPKVTCFGADVFVDEKSGDKRYSLSVQFNKEDLESDEKTAKALDVLKEFTTQIKAWAKSNSQDLFKKKNASNDYIDACFTDFLKESKDKDTEEPDGRYFTLKLKLKPHKKKEGTFDFGAFDSSKAKMDITKENVSDTIRKWSTVKCVITPNIYVIAGKLGVTWNLWQMQYWEPEGAQLASKDEFCMIDSSDEEEEEDHSELVEDESD